MQQIVVENGSETLQLEPESRSVRPDGTISYLLAKHIPYYPKARMPTTLTIGPPSYKNNMVAINANFRAVVRCNQELRQTADRLATEVATLRSELAAHTSRVQSIANDMQRILAYIPQLIARITGWFARLHVDAQTQSATPTLPALPALPDQA